jgi:hypothetical protein
MAISEATAGNWVKRDEPGAVWHEAQSVFIGEVLTKCGKFMPEHTQDGDELLVKKPHGGVRPLRVGCARSALIPRPLLPALLPARRTSRRLRHLLRH